MNKHHKIINFLIELKNSHPSMEKIYTNGSCMNLFCILKSLWPEAVAYYNIGHIITKIDDKYYDINGQVFDVQKQAYAPFTSYYPKKGTRRAFNQMYKLKYKKSICNTNQD